MSAIGLAEGGWLPDSIVRGGIRRLLRHRLAIESRGGCEGRQEALLRFLEFLGRSPIAIATAKANEQHYEVPAAFFVKTLGPALKYSCCQWDPGADDLAAAEERMLELTAARAGIADGMEVLELGCGWGAFSLWVAQRFPGCRVLAVSNSATQREFIEARCRDRGVTNLEVRTCDMNAFETDRRFDRVVSIEMFEHMRNYERLLERIAGWLQPDGRLFVHSFVHRDVAYEFTVEDETDWMGRHFFTGGIMPSDHLLLYFPRHLAIERHWHVNGTHYARTLDAWLANMDRERGAILPLFRKVYGADARRWFQRWRIFMMACSELFGFRGGNEWFVAHYLFRAATVANAQPSRERAQA